MEISLSYMFTKQKLRELLKEIAEEDAAKAKEPEFKIDGPGFYETRDGKLVCIVSHDAWPSFSWVGYHQWGHGLERDGWKENGKCRSIVENDILAIVKKLTFKEK